MDLLRRRLHLVLLAAALGVALPLGTSMAMASAAHHGSAPHQASVSLAPPALADLAPSPGSSGLAGGAASGSMAPGSTVRFPMFGGQDSAGPPPAARPGSRLTVPSAALEVAVVDYGDCAGNTPMTRVSAVHFLCTPSAVTAFVGHNPGVFTPLLKTHAGDHVYYQHDGVQDEYILGAARRVSPQDAAAASQDSSFTHAVFATCAEPDSSAYWIFIATPSQVGGGPARPSSGSAPQQPAPNRPQPAPSPSPSPGGTPGGAGGGGGLPGPVQVPSPPPL